MGIKKRGKYVWLILLNVFLVLLCAQLVIAGYCANPGESDYYCIEADVDDCCPSSADYYGDTGAPSDQTDCQDAFYDDTGDDTVGGLCDVGCCYYDSELTCDSSSTQPDCEFNYGTFDADGCEGSTAITYCAEGCCVYDEGTGSETSVVSSSGYCSALTDSGITASFAEGVTDESSCSDLAAEYVAGTYECFDGVDNDSDGATDYPADSGCSDYTDSSEDDATSVCSDGEDNDGDGYIDLDDEGCCESEDTANEQLCEVGACGEGEITSACNCYGDAEDESDGTYCAPGNYCVDGVCQSEPEDAECSPGERQYCGTDDVDGTTCLMYQTCQSDYTWTDCELDYDSCGQEPEVCSDGSDNDGDGLVDCQDIDCYETYCGTSSSSCDDYGFSPENDGNYVCCSTTDIRDCDSDGNYETCGSCDCLTTPITPEIEEIEFTLGAAQLTVSWELACAVEFTLLRCTGEDCTESIDEYSAAEIEAAFPEVITTNLDGAWEYTDIGIDANQRYCYVVKAEYSDHGEDDTYSDPVCVDDSGDYWCQQLSTSEFCLDDSLEMSDSLTYRYGCTEDNQLSLIEQCSSSGADYICVGPYDDGTTECVYQSDCATCGDPLGLYAVYDTSTLLNDDDDDYGELCYELPMCYFDYTPTTVNNFHECAEVTSCYDYASQNACEGQTNDAGFTNKCLQRNCAWEYLGGEDDSNVPFGVCKETSSDYAECGACNDAVNNGVFDACTQDRCQEFGIDDATCYLSGLTGECTDLGDFTCTAYTDSTSCTGGIAEIVLDDQTNEITTASEDALGLGVCYWDGDECFKDANADQDMDDQQEDLEPPTTTVLSDTKMSAINITILANDNNADGSSGSGVAAVYYCIDEDGSGCDLDRDNPDDDDYEELDLDDEGLGYIEDGDGSGDYTLYYFAQDYAENLEVVNTWDFEVDKSGPEITITYYVGADTTDPYDESSLTFEVTLDEEAYCTDTFEGEAGEIDNQYNDHFVVRFEELSDGWYIYSVECTDAIGNTADAFVFANVDADTSIFDTQPAEFTDESTVTLSAKTFQDAECGFSYNQEEDSFENMDYGFSSSDEGDYYLHSEEWTLEDGNGLYFFDVKCELEDGTQADDEIQFVYDDTAPETDVVDSFGSAFDFTAYYEGEDIDVYLACEDEPEYGFGCDTTYYCASTSQCTPDTYYDPTDSISYGDEEDEIDSFYVCYYSTENTYAGMGGLVEDTQCTELTVDYYDPSITITSPEDQSAVYLPYVTIEGEVDDPDATSGTAINTVEIVVINTDGDEITYSDIDASEGTFSYTVENLTLETNSSAYNMIYVTVTDRSGATAEAEVSVLYTSEIEGSAIWIEEPNNGVSAEAEFDFIVGTFLEAEICGYSKASGIDFDSYIALESTASDTAGEYLYGASYSISESKDGIAEYVYVTCELVNGVQYSETFTLEYDSTDPEIEDLYIANSDGKEPPSVVEEPLDPVVVVETDDPTICKYSMDSSDGFSTGMTKFDNFDDGNYSTENNVTITGLDDQTDYTVYVACQNGAYAVSDTESLSFTIDSTAASDMYLIEPSATGSRTFTMTLGTTRTASSCSYGESEDAVDVPMTDISEQKQWQSSSITVTADGVYTYYFSCWFVDGEMTDYFEVIVDTTGPEIEYIEDGNVSYSETQLSATWSATDDLTEVVSYAYSIGSKAGYTDVVNWTDTEDDEVIVDGLNLTNQSTYYWNVQAYNEVDLASSVDSSDGVFIDASGNGADPDLDEDEVGDVDYSMCSNDELDDEETDVDCGGDCDACADGYSCEIDDDCISLNCDSGVCAEATCTDGIQNQGESDIDCGGNYCDACAEGYSCVYHRDCDSEYCEGKVCTAASCYDSVKNGDEEGIDCGGDCPDICEDVVYQQDDETHLDDDSDGDGIGLFGWFAIILLLASLGLGGYYAYTMYMKKKGKPVKGFGSLSKGLPGLGKSLPSIGRAGRPGMRKMPASQAQRTRQMQQARSKSMQQKQAMRSKLFAAFDDKKPSTKLQTKKPSATKAASSTTKRTTKAAVATKPQTKKPGAVKATPKKKSAPSKKLGSEVVVRKPKKGRDKSGDVFSQLDKLIKKKKK